MLPRSKLLSFFVENKERLKDEAQLIGDLLLVERIKFPETKVGGIILAASTSSKQIDTLISDQPAFFRVLLAGSGYYDDTTKADIPLDINQGDIILTGEVSVKTFSTFPMLALAERNLIGITRHGDVQMRFQGEEAFTRFLNDFNSRTQEEVQRERHQSGTN